MEIIPTICRDLNIKKPQVTAAMQLLDQGNTIPFIARYRKERTGSLDEVTLTQIRDRAEALHVLFQRKETILASLKERNLLTPSLSQQIQAAHSKTILEDLYEKYRPKKKTRAATAIEKGLEPLALALLNQAAQPSYVRSNPEKEAARYINKKNGVHSVGDALDGARDIMAQIISEDAAVRMQIRTLFKTRAQIRSKIKPAIKEEGQKFKDYFDWSEPGFKAPSHRVLAMLRGQHEGILSVHVLPEEQEALEAIEQAHIKNKSPAAQEVRRAIKDSYKRLLSRSIEKESIKAIKTQADLTAIEVFANNLKELLLSAPLGEKRILAIDPGFRTGCKVVCLDGQGKLLHHDLIYLHKSGSNPAKKVITDLTKRFKIEAMAIGNGTGGRETQAFIKALGLDKMIHVLMVDESGASIYSASQTAREEFPDHDITVRGAVSIGRRLLDPLAELAKLDPKSIGVGQYQHDVDKKQLQKSLDDVVVSCVNSVGVHVNTASKELLARVSGLNLAIASNIVAYRNENGPFKTRKDLLKVPRLGPKAFEQAAGFLRIPSGKNPLDASGIHPESYPIVEKMARDEGLSTGRLLNNTAKIKGLDLAEYTTDAVGMPTLKDIAKELENPGRDPRKNFQAVEFDDTIHDIKDLVPGMVVPGIVTNVTAFGAFVDIGVHQDGLVHISQMADHFVKDPNALVSVNQEVRVVILDVDLKRSRIALSMKKQMPGLNT